MNWFDLTDLVLNYATTLITVLQVVKIEIVLQLVAIIILLDLNSVRVRAI